MRIIVTLFFALALAETAPAVEGWESGAHVGYGVMQRTSTGFDNVGGSLAYFDVARRLDPDFTAGLRTLMQGGRAPASEYYRMGVGPYASYRATETLSFDLGVSRFSESALNQAGDRVYRSSGYGLTVGWERRTLQTARFALSWGGFIGWHRGQLDDVAAAAASASSVAHSRFQAGAANVGLTRGLALSLAFQPQAQ